jgi:hypothetical protein
MGFGGFHAVRRTPSGRSLMLARATLALVVLLLVAPVAYGQDSTFTPDDTKTATATGTPTRTGTSTPTGTQTRTATATPTVTATATSTGTATQTGTVTQTPTPTQPSQQALALNETCASPPCSLAPIPGGHGVKTIVVVTHTGTATVTPMCLIGGSWLNAEVQLGSLSGASCTTTANCLLTTTAQCDQVYAKITACGSSCRVSAWLRDDPYREW